MTVCVVVEGSLNCNVMISTSTFMYFYDMKVWNYNAWMV